MTKYSYKVACGRIAGRSHAATNTPCQDFVAVRRSSSMACAALADGAGSRDRSEIGAEVVVRAMLRMLSAQFDELYSMCNDDLLAARQRIHSNLIGFLERAAHRHGCATGDLASTLIFVAYKGGRFLAGHIGDGMIAQLEADSAPATLSRPDNGEFANSTVFVTDPSALERFRVLYGESDRPVIGFALMSDGCTESLYDKKTGLPATAVAKLLTWNQELSRTKADAILAANLKQAFAKKSSDDCSLALLSVARHDDRRSSIRPSPVAVTR
jgi:hypothetical protein